MAYANEQRKLQTQQVEDILKDVLPSDKEKAVSSVMYKMGFSNDKAKEYIKLLYNVGKIKYNKDRVLVWNPG